MKAGAILGGLIWVILGVSGADADGRTFSVRPGSTLQSASFSLERGRFAPYIGLDIIGLSVDTEVTETEVSTWSGWDGEYREVSSETDAMEGSALLLIPHIGTRYYFSDQRAVRSYAFGSLFKCLPKVKVDATSSYTHAEYRDGELVSSGSDSEDEVDGEVEDLAKDILGFWGLNLGFGAEYYMHERFSIAGEYGFRMLLTSADYGESDSGGSSGSSEWSEEWDAEVSAAFKVTYAAISLNYHF